MTQPIRRRRGRSQGFTLIEVSLALIVFLMMTLMFAAVLPTAMHAGEMSNHYAQAALLAQHKINQLRQAGYAKLDYTDLRSLGYVDAPAPTAQTAPCLLNFTQADSLVPTGTGNSYFPAGSTGTVAITNLDSGAALPDGSSPALSNGSVGINNIRLVTITIRWPITGQKPATGQPNINGSAVGTYTTSTMIVSSH